MPKRKRMMKCEQGGTTRCLKCPHEGIHAEKKTCKRPSYCWEADTWCECKPVEK